jgi:ubiquinone/menaquinone biosynthesis C-methylase UbiE
MDGPSAEESAAVKLRAQASFARSADRYVESATLAEGAELERMLELARLTGGERVLDVATGGGHTALAFAPHAREVVASDLTPAMLSAAARHLAAKGARNVRFEIADAESLPFQDAQFDVVTARLAPHHFPRPHAFVEESVRVLRPEGRLIIFDNMAPEDEELDAFVNRLEAWRDPSHVRSHRSSEWQSMLKAAGLDIEAADPLVRKLYPYADWTARQSMPSDEREALERWLLNAPASCAEFFRVLVEHGRVTSLEATFGLVAASVTVRT